MSLLSTNISKVKKLTLKGAKLPPPVIKEAPINVAIIERPPSEEEVLYSQLVKANPAIEELVQTLDLVSIKTGERIRKVEVTPPLIISKQKVTDKKEHKFNNNINTNNANNTDKYNNLMEIAQRLIKGEESYSKEHILNKIIEVTKVSSNRANKGFNMMLQAGAIEEIKSKQRYYLGGSTPF